MQASICLSNVGTGRRQQFDETQENHGKQDQRTEWKASKDVESKNITTSLQRYIDQFITRKSITLHQRFIYQVFSLPYLASDMTIPFYFGLY